jgi:hypothetical protein
MKKILNSIKGKFLRNKILFLLIFLSLIATSVGLYYNSVRDLKTTYHFAFKDGPEKEFKLFFQRASDVNEEKKVVNEIFNYNYSSIINFFDNQAYYVSNINGENIDKIYSYDFKVKEISVLFENPNNFIISDLFLYENRIYFIANENLYSFDMKNGEVRQLAERLNNVTMLNQNLPYAYSYNEFYTIYDNKVLLIYDNCKFVKEKCSREETPDIFVYDLNSNEISRTKISELDKNYVENKPFFGTNKLYRMGTLKRYTNDKGNENYNFRIFTQF